MKASAIQAFVAVVAVGLAALPSQPIGAAPGAGAAEVPTAAISPLLPNAPTVAPGFRAPQVQPTAGIVGVTQQPFVGIALQDAVAMALLANPNLAVSSSNVRIARYDIVQAKGAFDVQLRLEPSSNFSVTPPENLYFAGPGQVSTHTCFNRFTGQTYPCADAGPGNIITHESSFQYGIAGQAVSGTKFSAGILQSRTYNNTIINTYNPSYQAALTLSVTQPLLRNFGMNDAKRQLKASVIGADASVAQALVDASNTIAQVEDAYWNLVAAWRNVAIQEEALKDATLQQQSVLRLARRGAAAPIDAVESQTQVAQFQDGVIAGLQTVSQLQIQLKSLIVSDPNDPIWQANLVPSSPVQELPAAADLDAVIAQAQKDRPEVRQALDQRRQADLDRDYARNQELPQADVQAAYMSNGFAGLLAPVPNFEVFACNLPTLSCPTPPPQSQGNMAYAYHNLWAARYPAFNIAFAVKIPLDNSYARGLDEVARQEQEQAAIETQGVNQRIGAEARNALQAYESALSRLSASSSAREAAEAVYASELRRFHSGASTTFLVLRRQVELAQARGRELLAQTALNRAVVEIQRVEGTILTANGVSVQALGSKAIKH